MCLETGENVSSHPKTLLGLEIRDKVSGNRRNDKKCLDIREKVTRKRRNNKKCLKMGENVFSHFKTLLGLEMYI